MHCFSFCARVPARGRRGGYTLVEILVALELTLILLSSIVSVFAGVGQGISNSSLGVEQSDQLRSVTQQLLEDLGNATARPDGHFNRPEESLGYLEIIENASNSPPVPQATNSTTGQADTTAGERGDIIMLTCRNNQKAYVGRMASAGSGTGTSNVAEIAWFVRGNKLYRRVLLVAPSVVAAQLAGSSPASFYQNNDVSAHISGGQVVPNSLSDLVKRENRYAHNASGWPFDVRGWGSYGLPTLCECSSGWAAGWVNGSTPKPTAGPNTPIDLWDTSTNSVANTAYSSSALGQGTRVAEDVILNNVLEFDVKVYDPDAGTYVDMGSGGQNRFGGPGNGKSGLTSEYDTYPSNFENDGKYHMDGNGNVQVDVAGGTWSNGIDDELDGVVDDQAEMLTSPPYPVALRGIQVHIRCFEPQSKQMTESTVEQSFGPK